MILFVYGSGSLFFFFATLISFANIIFLDIAYDQMEKMRSIFIYIFKNAHQFPNDFVGALKKIFFVMRNHSLKCPMVEKHEVALPHFGIENNPSHIKLIRLSLLKVRTNSKKVYFRGYLFSLDEKLKTWDLKRFSLPFPLAIFSVIFMGGVLLWGGGSDTLLIQHMALAPQAPLIALGCVISFVFLSILTLQGLFTFYFCVSNMVGLLFLFILFIFGSSFATSYYAILAVFGSIALLDYVYDWRLLKKR